MGPADIESSGVTAQSERIERRANPRKMVDRFAYLAGKTSLLSPCERRYVKCRIVDTSMSGYRVVLLSPMSDYGERYRVGQGSVIKHEDGWQRNVIVRWRRLNVLGLEIMEPALKLLVKSDSGALERYACQLLGEHAGLYRLNVADDSIVMGSLKLELANGDRVAVRLRWKHKGEVCVQKIPQYRRLVGASPF